MIPSVGTKVRFRYTGETGIVVSMLEGDMILVRLDSDPGMEIPAFQEDLDTGTDNIPPGANLVKPGKERPEAPPRREIHSQYVVLKPKGLQISFEPMPGRDGTISRYKAWLLNDTGFDFLFDILVVAGNTNRIAQEGRIGGMSAVELGDLLTDDLSENPEIDLELQRITTAGLEPTLYRKLRVRPKQFFNTIQTVPILNLQAYNFVLLDSFEQQTTSRDAIDDLRRYTRQQLGDKPAAQRPRANSRPYRAYDLEDFATFVPEIDLHIEALLPAPQNLPKADILRVQLDHCKRFLDRALRLGVHRVYIIHGVGEGKLRDAIIRLLEDRPEITGFRNEFHPRYGYGATEVWLR